MKTYLTNCCGSTERLICDMLDTCTDITRGTFLRHVEKGEIKRVEENLGYFGHPSQGLTMAGDWHVSYHKGKYDGEPCVFFRHSAIEYIFT